MNLSNDVFVRDVYPSSPMGDSLGVGVTSPFAVGVYPDTPARGNEGSVNNAAAIGASGKPVAWWISLAVLLVTLMYVANHVEGKGSYANLRLSAYNIFIVTLSAVIGLSLFKVAATKFPVPGLSTVILAA